MPIIRLDDVPKQDFPNGSVEGFGGGTHKPGHQNGVSVVDLYRHPVQEEVPWIGSAIGSQPHPEIGVIEV